MSGQRNLQRPPSIDSLARQINQDPTLHRYATRAARIAIAEGETFETRAKEIFDQTMEHSVKPVINLTGVILHTGFGRARYCDEACRAVQVAAKDHVGLEIEQSTGNRGNRQSHVNWLLQSLSGAEDALVVNNCASAVILALTALSSGSPVLLSRGEMVEIGGQFRMPDIIKASGCKLVEVGCTNKTRIDDYQNSISEERGTILRCSQSNFRQIGFVSQPEPKDLAKVAKKSGWMFIDDIGSGCLVNTTKYGLSKERTLAEAVSDGADLVLGSGDKLLGGPQCGIILGSKNLVSCCRTHPLARAMRLDKLGIAALEATLRVYFEGRESDIPIWKYCAKDLNEVKRDCYRLKKSWRGGELRISTTELGGGSMPGEGIPTWRFGLGTGSSQLAEKLRAHQIYGRVEENQVWLDPRTAEPHEIKETCLVLQSIRDNMNHAV